MRGGKVVATDDPDQTNEQARHPRWLAAQSFSKWTRNTAKPGDVVMNVRALHVADDRKIETVRGVSFEVRKGEILGIAGVQAMDKRTCRSFNRTASCHFW